MPKIGKREIEWMAVRDAGMTDVAEGVAHAQVSAGSEQLVAQAFGSNPGDLVSGAGKVEQLLRRQKPG